MTNSRPTLRGRTGNLFFLLAVLATILAIVGQTWWAVDQDKWQTLAAENEHGVIAVRLFEEHATLTLREAERNLAVVVKAIHTTAHGKPVDEKLIRGVLTRAQPFNKVLKSLLYISPAGVASVNSIDYPAYQTDADDRTYVPYLLNYPDRKAVVIGQPFKRFYDGELVVPLARNIHAMDGHYLGILSTDISVSYFSSVYARAALESNALVAMFSTEGRVIVRSPFDESYLGMDISKLPAFVRIQKELAVAEAAHRVSEGAFEDDQFLGGSAVVPRRYIYRKIDGFPIITIFARELESVLGNWKKRSLDRIAFSGAMICFIVLLAFLLWQHINRLNESRASLRQSDDSLRVSESKFVSLFQHSPVPLALIRLADECIVEINDSFSVQLGYGRDEALGRTPWALSLWADKKDGVPYLEALRNGRQVNQLEVRVRDKAGVVHICLLSARVVDAGGVPMAIFSPIDVTRQREVESEIRELNTELEQRVLQRTLKLETANKELAEALVSMQRMQGDLMRSEKMAALGSLVAGVAHELNTPIGNSLMAASTLQHLATNFREGLSAGMTRARLEKFVVSVNEGADLLTRGLHQAAELVRSFKQVAVDQTSANRRKFLLRDTVAEILLTLGPTIRKTSHAVDFAIPEDIVLDSYPGPVGQVVGNLINNALLHAFDGRENGKITITATLEGADRARLCVIDDGVGIPEANLSRVFDPFFTTRLGRGGSGLGLNIVYNLAQNILGGEIHVDSTLGQGARFSVILPLVAPLAPVEQRQFRR